MPLFVIAMFCDCGTSRAQVIKIVSAEHEIFNVGKHKNIKKCSTFDLNL